MITRLWRRLRGKDLGFYVRTWLIPGDAIRSSSVLNTMRHANLIETQECEGPMGGPLLVIAPHPDDESIGPGGTLLRLKSRNVPICVVFLTDGSRDVEIAEMRRKEACHALELLGAKGIFLGFPPDEIPLEEASNALAKVVLDHEPSTLMLPFVLDDNDDHRRANQILLTMASFLKPNLNIWAYQVYTALPANRIVDITEFSELKSEAINCHVSQMQKRDWASFALGVNSANIRLLRKKNAKYLEAFLVVPLSDYLPLCEMYFSDDAVGCYLGDKYRSMTKRGDVIK